MWGWKAGESGGGGRRAPGWSGGGPAAPPSPPSAAGAPPMNRGHMGKKGKLGTLAPEKQQTPGSLHKKIPKYFCKPNKRGSGWTNVKKCIVFFVRLRCLTCTKKPSGENKNLKHPEAPPSPTWAETILQGDGPGPESTMRTSRPLGTRMGVAGWTRH